MDKNIYCFTSHLYVHSLFYDYVNYILSSTTPIIALCKQKWEKSPLEHSRVMTIIITKGSKQNNSWHLHFLRSMFYRKRSIYRYVTTPLSDLTLPFLLKIMKLFILFKWNSPIVKSSSTGMEGFVLITVSPVDSKL